jgi:hypothetical protein
VLLCIGGGLEEFGAFDPGRGGEAGDVGKRTFRIAAAAC